MITPRAGRSGTTPTWAEINVTTEASYPSGARK